MSQEIIREKCYMNIRKFPLGLTRGIQRNNRHPVMPNNYSNFTANNVPGKSRKQEQETYRNSEIISNADLDSPPGTPNTPTSVLLRHLPHLTNMITAEDAPWLAINVIVQLSDKAKWQRNTLVAFQRQYATTLEIRVNQRNSDSSIL